MDVAQLKAASKHLPGLRDLIGVRGIERIIADGGEGSVSLGYAPVVEGKLGAVVNASAGYMEAGFKEMANGRSQLERLRARGGVFYNEEDGYSLLGETLFLDGGRNLLRFAGTDGRPCSVDGVEVPEIEYNLETGKVKTRLSSRPGSFTPPRKVGN